MHLHRRFTHPSFIIAITVGLSAGVATAQVPAAAQDTPDDLSADGGDGTDQFLATNYFDLAKSCRLAISRGWPIRPFGSEELQRLYQQRQRQSCELAGKICLSVPFFYSSELCEEYRLICDPSFSCD